MLKNNAMLKFGSRERGLGDTLLLTSICKYNIGTYTVQLRPEQERFKILFDSLSNVEITSDITYPAQIGGGHYATRVLRGFYENADYLNNKPIVLHSSIESEAWAKNYLSEIKNPIIFSPTCSKKWAGVRNIPNDLVNRTIFQLKKQGFSPIICSSSENVPDIDHGDILLDLDLSKYISLLRLTGEYVGCNTGDMHLAISVGAKCTVFEPLNCSGFCDSEWSYKDESITYIKFKND